MKAAKLDVMSVDALVERFTEISMQQDEALFSDNTARFNKLYKEKSAVVAELKSREGDKRRALLSLYGHPNMQVRLNAAMSTLAVEPRAARQMLEVIQDSKWPPQYLDAGMTLLNLDDGTFKPT